MPLNLLIVGSETPEQQDARRRRTGRSSCETYAQTLKALAPDASIEDCSCVDGENAFSLERLRRFDGVFFAGSPVDMGADSAEARSAAEFMTRVFDAGTPSFGSCAGLQIAAVAAGGTIVRRSPSMKAGLTRGIVATEDGRRHPLLDGRPFVWDAPALHADVVERMPQGGTVLARSKHTPVEAAEIRRGAGYFWGVQYHPEIDLAELAEALRRETEDLKQEGLARDEATVETYATHLEALAADPDRTDLAWLLGLDEEVVLTDRRIREIGNCLRFVRERTA